MSKSSVHCAAENEALIDLWMAFDAAWGANAGGNPGGESDLESGGSHNGDGGGDDDGAVEVEDHDSDPAPNPIVASSPCPEGMVHDSQLPSAYEEVPDSQPVEFEEVPLDSQPVENPSYAYEEVPDSQPVEFEEVPLDSQPVENPSYAYEEVPDSQPMEIEEVLDSQPVENLEEVLDPQPVVNLEEVLDPQPVENPSSALEEVLDSKPMVVEEVSDSRKEVPDTQPNQEVSPASSDAPVAEAKGLTFDDHPQPPRRAPHLRTTKEEELERRRAYVLSKIRQITWGVDQKSSVKLILIDSQSMSNLLGFLVC